MALSATSGNQLVDEQDRLDDIDEYDGMSAVQIAQAITIWPEGSEEQRRAIVALGRRAPGIGHNRPPLDEAIDDELKGFREQQAALLGVAATAVIIDDLSAEKVVDLIAQMQALERLVGEWHDKRKAPYLAASRLIDTSANAVAHPLVIARQGTPGAPGGLRRMLTVWEDRKAADAEAARQKALAEQREREEAALELARAAEEAARSGVSDVAARQRAADAAAEADRAAARAQAVRPEPTRGQAGQVQRSRVIKIEITELRKALAWLLKETGGMAAAEQFFRSWLGTRLKAIGVEAVANGRVTIPGVTLTVVAGEVNIRR